MLVGCSISQRAVPGSLGPFSVPFNEALHFTAGSKRVVHVVKLLFADGLQDDC